MDNERFEEAVLPDGDGLTAVGERIKFVQSGAEQFLVDTTQGVVASIESSLEDVHHVDVRERAEGPLEAVPAVSRPQKRQVEPAIPPLTVVRDEFRVTLPERRGDERRQICQEILFAVVERELDRRLIVIALVSSRRTPSPGVAFGGKQ